MISLDDITLVIALDKPHLAEFLGVWQTWVKFHPEVIQMKKLFLCDGKAMSSDAWELSLTCANVNSDVDVVPLINGPEDQREAMLGLFVVRAPEMVETPYWMKIDTDAVCAGPGELIRQEWFQGDPAIIAPSWGYTKPIGHIRALDKWAEETTGLNMYHRPLDLSKCETSMRSGVKRVHHSRITSWISIIETRFSLDAADFITHNLPVPSQDTYHWYVASRMKRVICATKQIRKNWAHLSGRKTRNRKIKEVME
jgi:hypothetical protein